MKILYSESLGNKVVVFTNTMTEAGYEIDLCDSDTRAAIT